MKQLLGVLAVFGGCLSTAMAADPLPKPIVTGLSHPSGVTVGTDGRMYVAEFGDENKDDTGRIVVVEDGKAVPFATGFKHPHALVAFHEFLFVLDKGSVWRVDKKGQIKEFAPNKAFFGENYLSRITVDELGNLYVCNATHGDNTGLFRVNPMGKVTQIGDPKKTTIGQPMALTMDGLSHLLVAEAGGKLRRIKLADGTSTLLHENLGEPGAIAWDHNGRLYITDNKSGKLFIISRPGDEVTLFVAGFKLQAALVTSCAPVSTCAPMLLGSPFSLPISGPAP